MSRKALCIEPSASLRELLGGLLRDAGWDVELCPDLTDVSPVLLRRGIDLVLTAAQLPSGDYGDVLQRFRSGSVSGAFPIVLLTSDVDAKAVATALVKGVTEVFSKTDLGPLRAYLDTLGSTENGTLNGLRALVLDDDVTMGLYLGQILGELGMTVDRFVGFDDALAAASANVYDLAIVDIVLGSGESGNHFIRLLRQSSRVGRNMPVIAVSGYSDSARRLDALRAGANVFLVKPLEEEELRLTIRRLLGEEIVAGPLLNDEGGRLYDLSKRELAICKLVASGLSDKRIAEQLGISYWTVRTHLASTFRKCGVMNRVELANMLREAEERASGVADSAMSAAMGLARCVLANFQSGVLVTDSERRIIYVNQAFTRITGYEEADVLGKTPAFLGSGKHPTEFFFHMLRQLKEVGNWSGEIWDRHKDGQLFLAWLDIRRLPPGAPMGACYAAVIADVTERQVEFDQIRHYALHDALTGLGNRTLLENRWSYEIARARRSNGHIGILFVDLDRFKQINDTLGHEIGDHLLVIAAARIRSCVRDNDTVVRYGGDEFVVLVSDLNDREAILGLADKVLEAVHVPVEQGGIDCRIGASVGISVFPEDGSDLESLVGRADAAMYRAKEAGGNVARFFGGADGRGRVGVDGIEAALARGDLELCFQPRVAIESSKMVAVGTQLRWKNGDAGEGGGIIALGERNTQAIDLFDWMLQEVCVVLRRLHGQYGEQFGMALKVPAVQLMRRNFVPEVATALARNGLPARCLQLELAEAAWVREPERMREVLGQLREMKVPLVLDGFGSGDSRLGLLKEHAFDVLKLDRELVRVLPDDRGCASIAGAVMRLAGDFGVSVLADGVDHPGLLAYLQGMGCDLAQGALFGQGWSETQLAEQMAQG